MEESGWPGYIFKGLNLKNTTTVKGCSLSSPRNRFIYYFEKLFDDLIQHDLLHKTDMLECITQNAIQHDS